MSHVWYPTPVGVPGTDGSQSGPVGATGTDGTWRDPQKMSASIATFCNEAFAAFLKTNARQCHREVGLDTIAELTRQSSTTRWLYDLSDKQYVAKCTFKDHPLLMDVLHIKLAYVDETIHDGWPRKTAPANFKLTDAVSLEKHFPAIFQAIRTFPVDDSVMHAVAAYNYTTRTVKLRIQLGPGDALPPMCIVFCQRAPDSFAALCSTTVTTHVTKEVAPVATQSASE